jgi:hypothetical protein
MIALIKHGNNQTEINQYVEKKETDILHGDSSKWPSYIVK